MSGKRVAGTLPTNVLATFADYNHHYRPYEAMSEGSVGAMLKRVEEVLQYVDRVFEHNRVLFVSADYGTLTSKHQSYLVELAEEKRLHQTPIDDIVSKSPILSLLYALKERGLDRATILLRKVEIFQSEILAAIQPCSHRGFSVVMDEPPEAFDSDRKFLAATSF
ncbi:hypothetical protein FRC08_000364 [Ceratobasidium sp. 394]|nr:hypothetical protein FRC08_000364 [Ceratobasidium sp. 394]